MRKLKSVGVVALLSGFLLAVGLWSGTHFHLSQVSYLPDGSTLVLEGWDYGKMHVLKRRGEHLWQTFLPPRLVDREETTADTVALWLHVVRPTGSTQQLPASAWWDWAEVSDDRGNRVRTVNYESPHVRVMSATDPLYIDRHNNIGDACLILNAFPRRGANVTTRFFLYGRQQPVAVFTAPNPVPGNYPTWTPQPLPLTQQQGDLKVSLITLQPSKYYMQYLPPNIYASRPIKNLNSKLLPGELGYTQAVFKVVDHGKVSPDWQYEGIPSFQDATGNIYNSSPCFGSPPGQVSIGFQLPNSTEPSKLTVAFRKTLDATYLPQDLHTLHSVQVASPNTFLPSGTSFQYKSHTIKLLGTGGVGSIHYPLAPEWKGDATLGFLQSNAPSLRFQISPPAPGLHLVLKAQDEKGNAIHGFAGFRAHSWLAAQEEEYGGQGVITSFDRRRVSGSSTDDNTVQMRTFFLDIPPQTRSLNLTLAIDEKRTFEFLLPAP